MSSSNHMGKTFIEANCDNNKHTGENAFLHLLLLKGFFSDRVMKLVVYLV